VPIIRKIIDIGKTSKGVIIPKSWLNYLEYEHGKIETVSIEVNGKITISPILTSAVFLCMMTGLH
jgi:antitoxin component of MazEF toxin-antitoxin module